MNDIVQYFVGAICPVFDSVMTDWKEHIEIVCVYGASVSLMALVTLYTILSMVKSCIAAFAHHVGGGKNV